MIYLEKIRNIHIPSEQEGHLYDVPSIRGLKEMTFRRPVTFLVGENGSGKSTLAEAIAFKAGFNIEGGGRNFHFDTASEKIGLYEDLKLIRSPYRNKDGFFFRSETFHGFASELDRIGLDVHRFYGGKSLHLQSHGEGFLSVFLNRFRQDGLYIFDEPESGMSLQSLFTLMAKMKQLVDHRSQFIISTHSPVLLAFPEADIYTLTTDGPVLTPYEETDVYRMTWHFLTNYREILTDLLR